MNKKKKNKSEPVDKRVSELEIGERTWPRHSGKFRGVSIGRDKDGYYVCTHRARSKSYESVDKITKKDIKFIKSTGKLKSTVPVRRIL